VPFEVLLTYLLSYFHGLYGALYTLVSNCIEQVLKVQQVRLVREEELVPQVDQV